MKNCKRNNKIYSNTPRSKKIRCSHRSWPTSTTTTTTVVSTTTTTTMASTTTTTTVGP